MAAARRARGSVGRLGERRAAAGAQPGGGGGTCSTCSACAQLAAQLGRGASARRCTPPRAHRSTHKRTRTHAPRTPTHKRIPTRAFSSTHVHGRTCIGHAIRHVPAQVVAFLHASTPLSRRRFRVAALMARPPTTASSCPSSTMIVQIMQQPHEHRDSKTDFSLPPSFFHLPFPPLCGLLSPLGTRHCMSVGFAAYSSCAAVFACESLFSLLGDAADQRGAPLASRPVVA